MADSIRKGVLDAIETALLASTGINYATQSRENWWDWERTRFPGVTIIDRNTDSKRVSFFASTSTNWKDSQDEMNISIRAYSQDQFNNLETKRANLVRDVIQKMHSSTGIAAKVLDVEYTGLESDEGILDNFSVVDVNFKISYVYNHSNP